jgi:hypothetical protein
MKKSLTAKLAFGLALGTLVSAMAGAAYADGWHDHEVRAYHHWHPHPGVVVEPAPVVYAPPVVYSPPPPPAPGINLILPLHFG